MRPKIQTFIVVDKCKLHNQPTFPKTWQAKYVRRSLSDIVENWPKDRFLIPHDIGRVFKGFILEKKDKKKIISNPHLKKDEKIVNCAKPNFFLPWEISAIRSSIITPHFSVCLFDSELTRNFARLLASWLSCMPALLYEKEQIVFHHQLC